MRHRSVSLLLAAGIAFSQPPSPTPPKATEKDKSDASPIAKEQERQDGTTIVIPRRAEITIREQRDTGNEGQQKSPTDWWAVFNTGLLTFFTGTLAWLAHRQRQAMEKQAEYMRDALAATKKAADAARDNIDMMISKERARLKIGPPLARPDAFSDAMWTITNHGLTKAFVTDASARVYCIPANSIKDFSSGLLPFMEFTQLPIRADDMVNSRPMNFPPPIRDAAEQVRHGKLEILFVAVVKYRDVFGVKERRASVRLRLMVIPRWASQSPADAEPIYEWQRDIDAAPNENEET